MGEPFGNCIKYAKKQGEDVSRQKAWNQLNIVVYVCGEQQETTHEESWWPKKGLSLS